MIGIESPVVTVIIPTHNRPETLYRLLVSLGQIRFPGDKLHVCVVGGAEDAGRGVVRAFAANAHWAIEYHVVPESELGSASFKRNLGAFSAKGSILAFTDDDCVVDPDWIAQAVPLFRESRVGAVEGRVEIDKPARPTFTYRSSQRLSHPGGYQTCNMLYRKSVFVECGGFDLHFPYYLEDTDLAYTVLERGYEILFAPLAVVRHPVQTGRPLKLLTLARTVELMPYLYRKHTASARQLRKIVKPFNRSHYIYLALYGLGVVLFAVKPLTAAIVVGIGLSIVLLAQIGKDHWGLHFTIGEVTLTALCQPIVPILRLYYWTRGNARTFGTPEHGASKR
jgi:GT2 family glycosyltransferase